MVLISNLFFSNLFFYVHPLPHPRPRNARVERKFFTLTLPYALVLPKLHFRLNQVNHIAAGVVELDREHWPAVVRLTVKHHALFLEAVELGLNILGIEHREGIPKFVLIFLPGYGRGFIRGLQL